MSTTNVSAFAYGAVVASRAFLDGAPWGDNFLTNVPDLDDGEPTPIRGHLGIQDTQTLKNMVNNARNDVVFSNISRINCLQRYSDLFAQHSNLMVIVDDYPYSDTSSLVQYHYTASGLVNSQAKIDQREWICANSTGPDNPDCYHRKEFDRTQSNWDKFGYAIQYCLAQNIEASTGYGNCQMKFSPPLALGELSHYFPPGRRLTIKLVVCICILFKVVCMWCTYGNKDLRSGTTLCTMGDAVAEFLQREDMETRDLVNVTSKELYKRKKQDWEFEPREWSRSKKVVRWGQVTSPMRLGFTFTV